MRHFVFGHFIPSECVKMIQRHVRTTDGTWIVVDTHAEEQAVYIYEQ